MPPPRVSDGPYDAVCSIGMAEHVGAAMLPMYAADLFALVRPEGRLLNHAISRRPGPPTAFSETSFIDRYVFPDGELEPIAMMLKAIEGAGFEVRDIESLREHYALTLRAWVANLERHWDQAVAVSSAGRARIWRLYMAVSALAFEANRLGVKPGAGRAARRPRAQWHAAYPGRAAAPSGSLPGAPKSSPRGTTAVSRAQSADAAPAGSFGTCHRCSLQ